MSAPGAGATLRGPSGDGVTAEQAATLAVLHADVALSLTDPSLPDEPLIWVNDAFCRLTGYTREQVLGLNCRLMQGPDTDADTIGRLRDALVEGRTATEVLLNHRSDGGAFWNQLIIAPVRDAHGAVRFHLGIQTDVSARVHRDRLRDVEVGLLQQTTARLQLLGRVSDVLAEHLEYAEAVEQLADVTVPAMASWGYVAVTDDRGLFSLVHVVASDPERAEAARELQAGDLTWLKSSPRVTRALAPGPVPLVLPEPIDAATLPERTTPRQLELLRRLGLGSSLVVPLQARDRVIGVLVLVADRPDGFDTQAVVTAAHLGRRAGLALDNARLYLAERANALALQHRLLPRVAQVDGLDASTLYLPSAQRAEIGGDWYDVLALPDGATVLAVGDVVGHDMVAAASMGQISTLLRALAWAGASPAQVVAGLDDQLRGFGAHDVATCVVLRWERQEDGSARVTWARAGHPPPMLLLPDGVVRWLDESGTMPVGLAPLPRPVPQSTVVVPPGATLVAYSDGLVERRNRPLRDGLAALEDALSRSPRAGGAEAIRDHLVAELVPQRPEDDVCLLVVRPV